jgi:uncharacterized protein YciI
MSTISAILIIVFFSLTSCKPDVQPMTISNPDSPIKAGYDSALAAKYGADEYGMRKYVVAFLKRGPNQDMDSAKAAELQMAHLKNIMEMARQGKLVVAGPFFGNDDLRGIYIFNVSTVAEAEALTNNDPAIQAGRLSMELKEWYGSAALLGLADIEKRIVKKQIFD